MVKLAESRRGLLVLPEVPLREESEDRKAGEGE
jgi:hypothetical protein